MKKYVFLILSLMLLSTTSIHAQVTIGKNANPHPSALLDLMSNSKGLLLPRVALTADPTEFVLNQEEAGDEALAVGMIVYNTADDMQSGKGIYFWDGVKWSPVCGGKKKETKLTFSLSRAVTDPRPAYDAYKEAPITFNGKYMFDKILVNDVNASNIVEARWLRGTKGLSDFRNEFDKVAVAVAKDPEHYPIYLGLKGSFTNFNEIMNYEGNLEERMFGPFDNNGREIVLPDYGTLTLLFLDMDAVAGGTSEEDAIIFYTFTINTSTNSSAGTALFDYTDYGSGKTTIIENRFEGDILNLADGISVTDYGSYEMYLNGTYTVYLRDDKGREGIQTIVIDNIRDGSDTDNALLWINYDTADTFETSTGDAQMQLFTLENMQMPYNIGYIELYEDIDCAGKVMKPNVTLSSNLDGKNHLIEHSSRVLFRNIVSMNETIVVKNIHFANVEITNPIKNGEPTGALLGWQTGASNILIENCSVSGIISSDHHFVGGLVGVIYVGTNMTIRNCFVSADIINNNEYTAAGGIAGSIGEAQSNPQGDVLIENCYYTGTISSARGGGIAGEFGGMSYYFDSAVIRNCFSTGNIISTINGPNNHSGGIVGDIKAGKVIGCYALNDSITGGSDSSRITTVYLIGGIYAMLTGNYAYDGMMIETLSNDPSGQWQRNDGTAISIAEASNKINNHYLNNSNWDFTNVWTFDYTGYNVDSNTNLPILKTIPKTILQNPNITPPPPPAPALALTRAVKTIPAYQAAPITVVNDNGTPGDTSDDTELYMFDKILVTPSNMGTITSAKWATGTQNAAYFSSNGTSFTYTNGIPVMANGDYTVYATDGTNTVVQTITLDNIRDGLQTRPIAWIDYQTADDWQALTGDARIQQFTLAQRYVLHLSGDYVELYEDISMRPGDELYWGSMSSHLNGNNHTINNLKEALFPMISADASVENLHLKNIDINTQNDDEQKIGGLTRSIRRGAELKNISVTGNITLNDTQNFLKNIGGIAGDIYVDKTTAKGSLFENVYVNINVNVSNFYDSSNYYIGGIVGMNGISNRNGAADVYRNCYTAGSVTATVHGITAGGIVGYAQASVSIEKCYSAMDFVTNDVGGEYSKHSLGGIAGVLQESNSTDGTQFSITNCYTLNKTLKAPDDTFGAVGSLAGAVGVLAPNKNLTNNYAYSGMIKSGGIGVGVNADNSITKVQATDKVTNHYTINAGWDFTPGTGVWTWSSNPAVNLPILSSMPEASQTPELQ